MRIRTQPSAEADLKSGFCFYEEREPEAGAYFIRCPSLDIDGLEIFAGIHKDRGGIYRYQSRKFPFWVYYRIANECAYVVAVLDARQDPKKIFAREQQERRRTLP